MRYSSRFSKTLSELYNALFEVYGQRHCTLDHANPLHLLIATILSAQCTDARVNKITPALFEKYPDVTAFAASDKGELESLVKSAGFFRSKSKSIIGSAKLIEEKFNGKVPATMEELISLPGVGRKTANVVLGDAFGVPGFPVDTHVKRLLKRIGLVTIDDPVKIEFKVTDKLAKEHWTNFSHMLIIHGRARCTAKRPDCPNCEIDRLCAYGTKRLKEV